MSEAPFACEPSYFIHTWTKCWVQNSLLYLDRKCHLNRRNWVKTRRLFPSKIFVIRKNPCLEPIIWRFNIPIILLKTWQFVAHGNTESRKMLIETKYHLSDRPNNRLTLSTHLMIKPNLCGTTIFVSFFFFFTVLYHSSGKQREMKELTHAF